MITIVLADDHAIVRDGLVPLLEAQPEFSVVAAVENGRAALDAIERFQPDIAVVDILMPEVGGIDVVRQAREISPKTQAVILSAYSEERYLLGAFRAGARAFVLKDARPRDLVMAITSVIAGQRYLSPPLAETVLDAYLDQAEQSSACDPYEQLTTREREVLHWTAEGKTAPQIASLLGISVRTVETHRANVMRKLGTRSKSDLVRYVVERAERQADPRIRGGARRDPAQLTAAANRQKEMRTRRRN